MRSFNWIAGAAMALMSQAVLADAPTATFRNVTYQGKALPAPAGSFRNPVMSGFQPDPSILRVGKDFYLVNSTFAYFPAMPVYHSTDMVHWRLIGHGVDRPEQMPFGNVSTSQGIYASSISHHRGTFYIVSTCVGCKGNFIISAKNPAGPWSDPVWLDFEGIDPSLFIDEDGSAWMVNNGVPEQKPLYDGHRAIWGQRFDLATMKLVGPRKILIDGGVHPQDKPIWVEGPHLFKHEGWYYLMPAEGGTAENHSETIWRSRAPDGPFVAGPVNPILTQRDLPKGRPNRIEATGHAELVKLANGKWWSVFLGTRPYAGQSTLLGRETYLLPVSWQDGWPLILPKGAPVPLVLKAPALPKAKGDNFDMAVERFTGKALGGEWLRLRTPFGDWAKTGAQGLQLTARADAPSGQGQPAFVGRRWRHHEAAMVTRLSFTPQAKGDFAGLLAYADESQFMGFGLEAVGDGAWRLALRERGGRTDPALGKLVVAEPIKASKRDVELRVAINRDRADLGWRYAGEKAWHNFAKGHDVEHLATIHAGQFMGLIVGPYAQAGELVPPAN